MSEMDPSGQLRFFRNNGDGTFTERTKEANPTARGLNIIQADYDNDGRMDVFVLRGAWFGEYGRMPKSLLRNNADGTFTDVTFEVGLGSADRPSQAAAWADYDHDGDLDLYIATSRRIRRMPASCSGTRAARPSSTSRKRPAFRTRSMPRAWCGVTTTATERRTCTSRTSEPTSFRKAVALLGVMGYILADMPETLRGE